MAQRLRYEKTDHCVGCRDADGRRAGGGGVIIEQRRRLSGRHEWRSDEPRCSDGDFGHRSNRAEHWPRYVPKQQDPLYADRSTGSRERAGPLREFCKRQKHRREWGRNEPRAVSGRRNQRASCAQKLWPVDCWLTSPDGGSLHPGNRQALHHFHPVSWKDREVRMVEKQSRGLVLRIRFHNRPRSELVARI